MKSDNRLATRDFLTDVSRSSGVPLATVRAVFDAMIERIIVTVSNGDDLMIVNFGKFSRQHRNGHKVHFGKKKIPDYDVLKFSATGPVNRRISAPIADDLPEGKRRYPKS